MKPKLPRLLSQEEFQRLSIEEKYQYVRTMHEFLNATKQGNESRESEDKPGPPIERDENEDKETRRR